MADLYPKSAIADLRRPAFVPDIARVPCRQRAYWRSQVLGCSPQHRVTAVGYSPTEGIQMPVHSSCLRRLFTFSAVPKISISIPSLASRKVLRNSPLLAEYATSGDVKHPKAIASALLSHFSSSLTKTERG